MEDVVLSGTLSAQDAEGDVLSFTLSQRAGNGTVSIEARTGHFVYVPNTDFFGTDEFSFTASDGKAASVPAQVAIAITGVNDPPTILLLDPPSVGESRQLLPVTLRARDPESAVAGIEVEEVGAGPVADFRQTADGFEFRLPETTEVRRVNYRLRLRDTEGSVRERDFTTAVLPLSPSGNLTTLLGDLRSPGMQWVITGDGYRADERAALLQRAAGIIEYTLSEPSMLRYRSAWNVHVLSVASPESGVDVPSQNLYRNTAFDATFDCQNIARLVCMDWSKVYTQVLREVPDFDALLVIVNSELYGGSGGFSGAVISNHSSAAQVLFHEMGHSFAGLGDEYLDASVESQRGGTFVEGRYANITQVTDFGQIRWRHWFADPNNVPTAPGAAGIGRFEGAYYSPTGYYRPADTSFMRALGGPTTPVHTEAWIRSLYSLVGPVASVSPKDTALTLAPNEERTFGIVRSFANGVQSVRWLLDGQEISIARDSDQLICCTGITGTHTLRVSVTDVTGTVRAPVAPECQTSRDWQLTIGSSPAAPKMTASTAAAKPLPRTTGVRSRPDLESTLFIRMRVDASGHQVEGIVRGARAANRRDATRGADEAPQIRYTITDAAGATLTAGEIADPRYLRGPMSLPDEPQVGHASAQQPAGYYLIRAPDVASLRYLRLEPRADAQAKALAVAPQLIDLAPVLAR